MGEQDCTMKEFLSHNFASLRRVSLSHSLRNAPASVAGLQSGLLTKFKLKNNGKKKFIFKLR